MSATICAHGAGRTCSNCRPLTGVNILASPNGLNFGAEPPLQYDTAFFATAEQVSELRKEIAELRMLLARLAVRVSNTLEGQKPPPSVSIASVFSVAPLTCPKCGSDKVDMRSVLLDSCPPQQPYTCRACGEGWNQFVKGE